MAKKMSLSGSKSSFELLKFKEIFEPPGSKFRFESLK
jgi:hypothetical protein|tara:strand:+ start:636 stop:746 length:111 start_codon:yes stop_codon:yes gene_type:complete